MPMTIVLGGSLALAIFLAVMPGLPTQGNILVSILVVMFGFFFADAPVSDWASAKRSDTRRFARFHRAMLERGVYFAPSQFEAAFLAIAHGDAEIDRTIEAAGEVFGGLHGME